MLKNRERIFCLHCDPLVIHTAEWMDLNTELLQRRMKWNGCYSGGVKRAAAVASSISFLGSLKLFYSDITRALKGRYCRFRCFLHTTISRSFSLKGSLSSILLTIIEMVNYCLMKVALFFRFWKQTANNCFKEPLKYLVFYDPIHDILGFQLRI